MTTFVQVAKDLSRLPIGEHKLSDIVSQIRSISSKKHDTQQFLSKQNYDQAWIVNKCNAARLDDIWVDISYQRSLKLKKIYDHLKARNMDGSGIVNFSETLAGTVEYAIRPNGKVFVWDGFRRCILALLKGIPQLPANVLNHQNDWKNERCRKLEAYLFQAKNSQQESMKQEELFKAGVAQGNESHLRTRDVLSDCELDVLGVNPGRRNLGGFVEFQKLVTHQPFAEGTTIPSNKFVEEASKMIQEAWIDEDVSGFMLSGLAFYLYKNELDSMNGNHYFELPETISDNLKLYVNEKGGTQSSCTKDRLHSAPMQSVAWRICKNVMSMSDSKASMFIDLNDDQSAMMRASN